MSEVKQAENVMSLEDLFLSHEFGKQRVAVATPFPEDTLFGVATVTAPLVPMVAAPMAGHLSTTHLRRNRMIAAASGVAAALLFGVAVFAQTGNSAKTGGVQASGSTTTTPIGGRSTGNHHGTGITPASNPNPPSGTTGGGTVGNLVSYLSAGGGSGNAQPGTTGGTTGSGGGGKPTAGNPSPTAPSSPSSPDLLSGVVDLVGNVVTVASNTVSGTSTTLGSTLPLIAPVTGVTGDVGSTLTGLGDMLSGTTV
jgi:hypothetical protein